LGSTPKVLDVGSVGRRISIQRIAEGEELGEVSFEVTDLDCKPGVNAYWVKVEQTDGEMAWSSPIYVSKTT